EPSHRVIRVSSSRWLRDFDSRPPNAPTAQASPVATAATPYNEFCRASGFGLRVIVQDSPFQCSSRVVRSRLFWSMTKPPAQTSSAAAASSDTTYPFAVPAASQFAPSQCRKTEEFGSDELTPTAHTSSAPASATDARTRSLPS